VSTKKQLFSFDFLIGNLCDSNVLTLNDFTFVTSSGVQTANPDGTIVLYTLKSTPNTVQIYPTIQETRPECAFQASLQENGTEITYSPSVSSTSGLVSAFDRETGVISFNSSDKTLNGYTFVYLLSAAPQKSTGVDAANAVQI